MPSILPAISPASSTDLAILTPPPLPRPPAWICALTTTPVAPAEKRFLAARSASSREVTISPRGTATPNFDRIAFAWYSWIFISYSNGQLQGAPKWKRELTIVSGDSYGRPEPSGGIL